MVQAIRYKFEDCKCLNMSGTVVEIPDGIWPVAELDVVSVSINGAQLDLEKNAFNKLKLSKIITRV